MSPHSQNFSHHADPSGLSHLADWVGRSESRQDLLTASPLANLSATLDRDDVALLTGSAVPPLWHWAYFTPQTLARDIGEDGHARRGGFLPPVPLPRRMWAGGRLSFHQSLRVGELATRLSTIQNVQVKQGRSGTLVFVCVRHEFSTPAGLALTEEHDIVYRDAPAPVKASAAAEANQAVLAPTDEQFAREIHPDPVLLFRYSAVTFNSHRIHYDRSYVTTVEGYPGLIVHGPLIATLLMDLLQRNRPQAQVQSFAFKAVRPSFDIHPFTVCGKVAGATATLWGRDHEGYLTMQATAELT